MKEEHIWTKKPETMLDWFCVVGACIALYLTLNNLGYFLGKIGVFIGIVSPFAGGIVIAYVLDPMVKFFYTKLFKEKKKTRGFAILLAYLVAILLLVLLAWLVIPQIVDSIAMLFTNFPSYIQSVQDMLGMAQERFGVDLVVSHKSAGRFRGDGQGNLQHGQRRYAADRGQHRQRGIELCGDFHLDCGQHLYAGGQGASAPSAAHAGACLPAGKGCGKHAAHLPLCQREFHGLLCGQDH